MWLPGCQLSVSGMFWRMLLIYAIGTALLFEPELGDTPPLDGILERLPDDWDRCISLCKVARSTLYSSKMNTKYWVEAASDWDNIEAAQAAEWLSMTLNHSTLCFITIFWYRSHWFSTYISFWQALRGDRYKVHWRLHHDILLGFSVSIHHFYKGLTVVIWLLTILGTLCLSALYYDPSSNSRLSHHSNRYWIWTYILYIKVGSNFTHLWEESVDGLVLPG